MSNGKLSQPMSTAGEQGSVPVHALIAFYCAAEPASHTGAFLAQLVAAKPRRGTSRPRARREQIAA